MELVSETYQVIKEIEVLLMNHFEPGNVVVSQIASSGFFTQGIERIEAATRRHSNERISRERVKELCPGLSLDAGRCIVWCRLTLY